MYIILHLLNTFSCPVSLQGDSSLQSDYESACKCCGIISRRLYLFYSRRSTTWVETTFSSTVLPSCLIFFRPSSSALKSSSRLEEPKGPVRRSWRLTSKASRGVTPDIPRSNANLYPFAAAEVKASSSLKLGLL